MPECSFSQGHFQCKLPEDTVDVEVKIRTMTFIPSRGLYHSNLLMQALGSPAVPLSLTSKKNDVISGAERTKHRGSKLLSCESPHVITPQDPKSEKIERGEDNQDHLQKAIQGHTAPEEEEENKCHIDHN